MTTLTKTDTSERLFSYGTLQLEAVQIATFGRRLSGQVDRLDGYRFDQVAIRDPGVVATSGLAHHPMLVRSGQASDTVPGTVFSITPAELAQADVYEVSDYRRDRVTLASGRAAWAYVDARGADGRE
ncbi:MAG: gamma-glutamylcyclotransferase family protein [Lautropia sp.]